MKLVVCPSRLFAIYLLAYVREFGMGETHHFLIENRERVPEVLKKLALNLNCHFLDEPNYSEFYDEIIVHSYFLFSKQKDYVLSFNFGAVSIYADGLRNGVYLLPRIYHDVKSIIYFGYIQNSESSGDFKSRDNGPVEIKVVSWRELEKVWQDLQATRTAATGAGLESSDLLLVMRYWGEESNFYEFKSNLSILDYLEEELGSIKQHSRLVYRMHPGFKFQLTESDLLRSLTGVTRIRNWDDLFCEDSDFPELTSPEAILWTASQSPKTFFGFDSSLGLPVGLKHPKTNLLWPTPAIYKKYFKSAVSEKIVSEHTSLMSSAMQLIVNRDMENVAISSSGYPIDGVISRMLIESWEVRSLQERDALTQERDALTQERDALTQERDALTQERDALTNSTIWRLTGPLRKILNILKN
jgi:hypothetical protein